MCWPTGARDGGAEDAIILALHAAMVAMLATISTRPADHPDPAGDAPLLPEGTTVAGIQQLAHELRAPLTVVQGFAETLRSQLDSLAPTTIEQFLDGILRNVRHASGLVDVVVDAYRADSDQLGIFREPLDIVAFVADLVADLRTTTHRHELHDHLPDAPEIIEGDPVRLRQVVTNLVSNAVKFSPAGGAVDVVVMGRAHSVQVAVEDRGPGVPDERRHELFQSHSRLGATAPGMGLGLYLSRAIARAHGGTLVHEARSGGGSRFVLCLPRIPHRADAK